MEPEGCMYCALGCCGPHSASVRARLWNTSSSSSSCLSLNTVSTNVQSDWIVVFSFIRLCFGFNDEDRGLNVIFQYPTHFHVNSSNTDALSVDLHVKIWCVWCPPMSALGVQGPNVTLHLLRDCVWSKHTAVFTGNIHCCLFNTLQPFKN